MSSPDGHSKDSQELSTEYIQALLQRISKASEVGQRLYLRYIIEPTRFALARALVDSGLDPDQSELLYIILKTLPKALSISFVKSMHQKDRKIFVERIQGRIKKNVD